VSEGENSAPRRRLVVLFRDEPCGWLEDHHDGSCLFAYSQAWLGRPGAEPISRRLPLRPEPYPSRGLHPFFLGLLPEGWLFDLAVAHLKLSEADPFGLVAALCRDNIGAVSLQPDEGARGGLHV